MNPVYIRRKGDTSLNYYHRDIRLAFLPPPFRVPSPMPEFHRTALFHGWKRATFTAHTKYAWRMSLSLRKWGFGVRTRKVWKMRNVLGGRRFPSTSEVELRVGMLVIFVSTSPSVEPQGICGLKGDLDTMITVMQRSKAGSDSLLRTIG